MEPNQPDSDRRGFGRRPPLVGTQVACYQGREGRGPDLTLYIVDVSEAGVRLLIRLPLEPGQEVRLVLQGPAGHPPIEAPARVIWSVALPGGRCCVGLSFERPLAPAELEAVTSQGKGGV